MKASVLQENLTRALDSATIAVDSKSRLPILGNVSIATNGGRLEIAATDLETWLVSRIGAKIEDEGATTMPARVLRDYVATLPPERVDLTLEDKTQTLTVHCARTDTRFKGIDAQEFPIFPGLPQGAVNCDGDAMLAALRACAKVKPPIKRRGYVDWLDAIKIEISPDTLTLTAMSSHAQARQVVATWGETDTRLGYIPRHTLDVLAKVIALENKGRGKHNRAAVGIGANETGIAFAVEHTTIYAEWQKVEFPEVKDTQPAQTFTIDSRELYKSLAVLKSFDSVVTFSVNGHLDLTAFGTNGKASAQLGEGEGYAHDSADFEFTADIPNVLAAIGKAKGVIAIGYAPDLAATVTAGDSTALFTVFTAQAVRERKRRQHHAQTLARREGRKPYHAPEAQRVAVDTRPLAEKVAEARAACVAALARIRETA